MNAKSAKLRTRACTESCVNVRKCRVYRKNATVSTCVYVCVCVFVCYLYTLAHIKILRKSDAREKKRHAHAGQTRNVRTIGHYKLLSLPLPLGNRLILWGSMRKSCRKKTKSNFNRDNILLVIELNCSRCISIFPPC